MNEDAATRLLAIFIVVAGAWIVGRLRWLGAAPDPDHPSVGIGGVHDPARVLANSAFYIFIPALLCLLQTSLESQQGFASLKGAFTNPLAKLVLIGVLWAFFHHFCAGIRYLFLDLDIGTDLAAARASSWAVVVVSIALTLACGVLIW